jgi:hypothetical protein
MCRNEFLHISLAHWCFTHISAIGLSKQLCFFVLWSGSQASRLQSSTRRILPSQRIPGFRTGPNQLHKASLGGSSIQEFFDTSAFAPQLSGEVGTARKNPLYGPHFRHVDLSVFKTFPVYRESTLEFRAEAFNIARCFFIKLLFGRML